jgi:hypothetical protein
MGQGEDSVPIRVQFTPLRRSGRQPAKRDYKKMQGPSTITDRLAKIPKLPDDICLTKNLPTDGPFKEPAADGSTSETPTETHSEHLSETFMNASATGTLGTSESTIDKSSVECPDTAEPLDSPGTDGLRTSA